MTEDLSADVKRHLARVYALVAACSLVAAGTSATLGVLVPWVAPYTYVVAVVSILGLIAVATAFSRTPTKHIVTRFALLAAVCSFGGAFLMFFFGILAKSADVWGFTAMLVMTSLIYASFSAAMIFPPQKKVTLYMVAFAFATVTVTVFSVVITSFTTLLWPRALAAVVVFALFEIVHLYFAWKAATIIQTTSKSDRDLVGDTASLFSDVFLSWLVGSCLSKRSGEEEPLLG